MHAAGRKEEERCRGVQGRQGHRGSSENSEASPNQIVKETAFGG